MTRENQHFVYPRKCKILKNAYTKCLFIINCSQNLFINFIETIIFAQKKKKQYGRRRKTPTNQMATIKLPEQLPSPAQDSETLRKALDGPSPPLSRS